MSIFLRKTGFMALCVLTLLAIGWPLAAGGSRQSGSADGPVELSWCRSDTSWGRSTDPDLIDVVIRKIEQATNTKINVIAPPHNGYSEKLNILLTSGDIPDIYLINDASLHCGTNAVRGYLAPLDNDMEAIPAYSYYKNNDLMINFRVNGVTYGIPEGHPPSKILWFREDLVKKYGLNLKEAMTTQEFKNELLKVNQREAVPFAMLRSINNFPFFHNAFSVYAGLALDANGKWFDGFSTPPMRQSLAYLKELYDAGIMDREFLTNTNAMIREKIWTGKAVSTLDYTRNYTQYRTESIRVGNDTEYIPVSKILGPDGKSWGNHIDPLNGHGISSKSKNVRKALEVLAYKNFNAEGVLLFNIGVEGQHFTIQNGVIAPTPKALASSYSVSPSSMTDGFGNPILLPFKWGSPMDELLNYQGNLIAKNNMPGELGRQYVPPSGVSPLYDSNSSLRFYVEEIISKVIIGNITMEKAFEDYAAYWRSIDGDKMLQELNK
jgi:putative aldouronate transport system substrate-binding protein